MTRHSRTGTFRPILLWAFILGLAAGCDAGSPDREAPPLAEGEGEVTLAGEGADEGHVLHVEPAQVEAWGLEIGPVGSTTVSAETQLPGILATNANRTAAIASLVAGQVAERMVDLGSRVTAGQIVAALNAPEFTRAQAAFLQAYARAELSRKDYERAVVLREERAMEEREFLRRQSVLEQAVAELRSAEVILHSFGVEEDRLRAITEGLGVDQPFDDHEAVEPLLLLRSPIGGVVVFRDAVLGHHVEAGQILFTVSDLSVLWARLDAYEGQLPGLEVDAEVAIRTPVFPDLTFPGRIDVVSDQVDPELRTVRVRVEVPNPDGLLKPNMYVQGYIRARDPSRERLVLPEEAVQLLDGGHVVFVALPPEPGEEHLRFEERAVVPGESLTEGRIILDGLDGSEQVVLSGAFTLKAEMTKGVGGHDHAH